MGKPSPTGTDQALQFISGQFTNTGVTTNALFFGAFNFAVWAQVGVTLTVTNGTNTAVINTNVGLIAGQTINSTNVPAGSTIATLSTNTLTINLPPGQTNTNITTAVDSSATFTPASWTGSIQLERSFDGGQTYVIVGIGGGGTGAIYGSQGSIPVSVTGNEPERGVNYRANMTTYTSGTVNWRLSAAGIAATAWGIQP